MTITVNGKQRDLQQGVSLLQLIQGMDLVPERLVMELNGTVIKRGVWNETYPKQGDILEIVSFVGGG